ncbi:MAG TPA: tryptophan 7-halogenase [Allosphingosinicella sp.]|nr:tryptophan 7-halogenase [Allosphingosinicella sp.]
MREERTIRTICVVGAGIVGLSAAIAFARALPAVRARIVAVPPDPAALADRLTGTLPTVNRFHAAIGLDELELVRAGIASHRLGTRFERWSADGSAWYHAFGDFGLPTRAADFHQLWVRARKAGRALPFHRFGAAAVLAEAGKFVHPSQDPASPMANHVYALRLDPDRYRERLEAQAGALALDRFEGSIGGVTRREDGGIAALVLEDGRRIEADLFIDCAGPSAPLLSVVADDFEDWGGTLPCDRLLLAAGAAPPEPSSCDVAAALDVGWRWHSPLPDGVIAGAGYAAALAEEGQARRASGLERAELVAIRPGRRPRPWVSNVLAVGDSAVAVDPLHGTNLHLAQNAIARALALLPGRDCHPLELREYNRQTAQETDRVRDFLALHYLRSPRSEGAFWKAMPNRPLPASLAHTLELYGHRGRLPFYEEESFDRHGWHAVLLGMGLLPRGIDPAASGVDFEQSLAGMERLAERLAGIVQRAPAYRDYLARMRSAGPR